MRLDMHSRQEIIKAHYKAYQCAGKKERGELLDRLTAVSGMNRDYLAWVLGHYGKSETGEAGEPSPVRTGRKKRPLEKRGGRPAKYKTAAFIEVLRGIWDFYDYPCGKLLAPLIRGTMEYLAAGKEIDFGITEENRPLLMSVSPAEIDILLKGERKKQEVRGKSLTKAGPVLKNEIPVRVYFAWDERKPGFFEVDRVAHCGRSTAGHFCWTLTATDVYSGWTEERSLLNNAHRWTKEAISNIRSEIPFPMYGIDTDNGGEFINTQLLAWCSERHIQFTRGRPYRKNDNCFVEQKNGDVVRKTVGYFRYETAAEQAALAEVYRCLCPLNNYFYPSIKITGKIRLENGKYRKVYDKPKTPYERLLESADVGEEEKEELRRRARLYNPVRLKIEMDKARNELLQLNREKAKVLMTSGPEVSARV
jgi:hypothetical protein